MSHPPTESLLRLDLHVDAIDHRCDLESAYSDTINQVSQTGSGIS